MRILKINVLRENCEDARVCIFGEPKQVNCVREPGADFTTLEFIVDAEDNWNEFKCRETPEEIMRQLVCVY